MTRARRWGFIGGENRFDLSSLFGAVTGIDDDSITFSESRDNLKFGAKIPAKLNPPKMHRACLVNDGDLRTVAAYHERITRYQQCRCIVRYRESDQNKH